MRSISKQSAHAIALVGLSLLLISLLASGCDIKPWRKFEEKRFDSKTGREGDAITRGEMVKDLIGAMSSLINKREDGVREQLGEPDSKTEGRMGGRKLTAWVYKISFNVAGGMDQFLVLLDDRSKLVVFTQLGSSDDPPFKQ